jgi:hypothetical protein
MNHCKLEVFRVLLDIHHSLQYHMLADYRFCGFLACFDFRQALVDVQPDYYEEMHYMDQGNLHMGVLLILEEYCFDNHHHRAYY